MSGSIGACLGATYAIPIGLESPSYVYGAAILNAEQVVDGLLDSVGGQIVACNIVAGLDNQLIEPALVREVLAWMGILADHQRYAGSTGLVRALAHLQTGEVSPDSASAKPPDFRLRGDAKPTPFQVEVSCVLPVHVVGDLVSDQDNDRLAREGFAMPTSSADFIASSTIREWKSKPASARTVRFDAEAYLGRRRSVMWFTPREAIEETLKAENDEDQAQRTRDALGLVHHQAGALLAALHFPPATLAGCPSARPTFADAAGHKRFKTWPDDAAARKNSDWGRTVDLRALDAASPSLDGCPERVTKAADGAVLRNGSFEFELLGTVRNSVGAGEAADAAFAKRLASGLTVPKIANKLKAL